MNALSTEMLKLAADWVRQKVSEKLSPPKEGPSPEREALDRIQTLLDTLGPRYGEKIDVKEVYDLVAEALRTPQSPQEAPLTPRRPFQPNPITANYIANRSGVPWEWPKIVGPCGLWFGSGRNGVPGFERIEPWSPGQLGDVAVLDSRYGGGYGATGFLVEDKGTEITLYVDDITTLQYRIVPKAAVLGYFRPANTPVPV